VRHYNYIPGLDQAGFDVTTAPLLDNDYLDRLYNGKPRNPQALLKAYLRRVRRLLTARRYDLIWIEKEALPWAPAMLETIFFGKQPVVIDFDDAWYVRYATHPNWAVRLVLGGKFQKPVSKARVVTTGSTALKNWAQASKAARVVQLPSAVDIGRYQLMPLPDGPFTIGWIGTPTNARYLELVADPLRYMQRVWGARVRVIGAEHFSLPGLSIDHIPWREETESLELAACHVGIMPLRDGLWEQGKCGYKVIQYMAAGRATVASPIGANTSIIVHGQTGFLAATSEDWISALSSLAADREQTRKLGLAARQRAEEMYSLQSNVHTIIAVLSDALRSSDPKLQNETLIESPKEVLVEAPAMINYSVSPNLGKATSAKRQSSF